MRMGLSSRLVQLASCSKVIEVYLFIPIKSCTSSVPRAPTSTATSSPASLGLDFSLLSSISFSSQSRMCSCIMSCSVFMPTPTPTPPSFFLSSLASYSQCLSWFLSSLSRYIFPIKRVRIFFIQGLQPQWQLSPDNISSTFWFWLPISFTTLSLSSTVDPSRRDVGLENSPNFTVLEMPVFLVDFMLMNSLEGALGRSEAKLRWLLACSMECSIIQISNKYQVAKYNFIRASSQKQVYINHLVAFVNVIPCCAKASFG